MEKIEQICRAYGIALCYIFGSRAEEGLRLLKGERLEPVDPESDIDFAVLFIRPPEDLSKHMPL
ncbi:MAG: nucleotidyltransferase domain-containing protein [Thermodesulfovibrionales bacterium]|nr:nucleotidyltransferase domain-containing protein [Thermodesulfovibrionales bacterium]